MPDRRDAAVAGGIAAVRRHVGGHPVRDDRPARAWPGRRPARPGRGSGGSRSWPWWKPDRGPELGQAQVVGGQRPEDEVGARRRRSGSRAGARSRPRSGVSGQRQVAATTRLAAGQVLAERDAVGDRTGRDVQRPGRARAGPADDDDDRLLVVGVAQEREVVGRRPPGPGTRRRAARPEPTRRWTSERTNARRSTSQAARSHGIGRRAIRSSAPSSPTSSPYRMDGTPT